MEKIRDGLTVRNNMSYLFPSNLQIKSVSSTGLPAVARNIFILVLPSLRTSRKYPTTQRPFTYLRQNNPSTIILTPLNVPHSPYHNIRCKLESLSLSLYLSLCLSVCPTPYHPLKLSLSLSLSLSLTLSCDRLQPSDFHICFLQFSSIIEYVHS
jgi:hypothetical protein